MSLAPVRSQDADRKGKGPGVDPGDPFDPADSCLLKWPQCLPLSSFGPLCNFI